MTTIYIASSVSNDTFSSIQTIANEYMLYDSAFNGDIITVEREPGDYNWVECEREDNGARLFKHVVTLLYGIY